MVVSKAAINEQDKFGTERFAAIKAQLANFKLNKDFQRRFDRIVTVFSFRRDIAHELHHAEANNEGGWHYRNKIEQIKERLNAFKSVQFFLDALQTLLDEVRKEEATKPPPRVRRYY